MMNPNKIRTSIAKLDEVIRRKKYKAKPYIKRGKAKNQLGKYESAIADFSKAIELKPDLQ